jgi:hypothetical protein
MSFKTPMGPGFFILFQVDAVAGGSGQPYYEDIPKRIIKRIIKKIRKIKQPDLEKRRKVIDEIIDQLPKKEIKQKAEQYQISQDQAVWMYKLTLYQLVDDDLALILILASI